MGYTKLMEISGVPKTLFERTVRSREIDRVFDRMLPNSSTILNFPLFSAKLNNFVYIQPTKLS